MTASVKVAMGKALGSAVKRRDQGMAGLVAGGIFSSWAWRRRSG